MWKIVKKEWLLFFSDRKAVLIIFLLPIVLVSIFVVVYGAFDTQESVTSRENTLLVVDRDSSRLSKNIALKLDSLQNIKVEKAELAHAQKQIKNGKRIAALVIHENFQDSIQQGNEPAIDFMYDLAKDLQVTLIEQSVAEVLFCYVGNQAMKKDLIQSIEKDFMNMNPGMMQYIQHKINTSLESAEPGTRKHYGLNFRKIKLVGGKQGSPLLIQSVAGIAVMMLLFNLIGVGASLIEEKESGTLKRLFYSDIHPFSILFGKWFMSVLISIAQLIVLFIFAWLVFGLDITRNIPALFVMIISTALVCASVGIFLATVTQSRKQLHNLSTIIILVLAAIGGSMIPLFLLPGWVHQIAVISLNYWAIEGFYDIFWRNLPFPAVLPESAVLLGMTALLLLLAMFFYKKNILKLI